MTQQPLCAVATCHGREHRTDCEGGDCRGCLPRLAADGSQLCAWHRDRIGSDARQLAELHGELEHRLLGGVGQGDKVSGTSSARMPDPVAIEVRTEIRHVLVSWSLYVADEGGITLPVDELTAIGAFVARYAEWLAARVEVAAEVSDELSVLRRRAWSVAYPSGTRTVPVKTPVTGRPAACVVDGCTGMLSAVIRPQDRLELPSAIFCDGPEEHSWASTAWHALGRRVREREREMMGQTPEVAA